MKLISVDPFIINTQFIHKVDYYSDKDEPYQTHDNAIESSVYFSNKNRTPYDPYDIIKTDKIGGKNNITFSVKIPCMTKTPDIFATLLSNPNFIKSNWIFLYPQLAGSVNFKVNAETIRMDKNTALSPTPWIAFTSALRPMFFAEDVPESVMEYTFSVHSLFSHVLNTADKKIIEHITQILQPSIFRDIDIPIKEATTRLTPDKVKAILLVLFADLNVIISALRQYYPIMVSGIFGNPDIYDAFETKLSTRLSLPNAESSQPISPTDNLMDLSRYSPQDHEQNLIRETISLHELMSGKSEEKKNARKNPAIKERMHKNVCKIYNSILCSSIKGDAKQITAGYMTLKKPDGSSIDSLVRTTESIPSLMSEVLPTKHIWEFSLRSVKTGLDPQKIHAGFTLLSIILSEYQKEPFRLGNIRRLITRIHERALKSNNELLRFLGGLTTIEDSALPDKRRPAPWSITRRSNNW